MEDWVQLHSLLRASKAQPVYVVTHPQGGERSPACRLETTKGKISVKGTAGTNAQHTINEDERRSFTDHINGVGDDDQNLLMTRSWRATKTSVIYFPSLPTPCSCSTSAEVSDPAFSRSS